MAQTSAVMVGTTMGLMDKNMLIYFMGIDNCKFRRKVVPGDVLRMTVQTTRGKPGGKVTNSKALRRRLTGNSPQKPEFTAMMDMQA
jgi:3-hydroxyacyl-[acyl-carrier-protein] dehydratase